MLTEADRRGNRIRKNYSRSNNTYHKVKKEIGAIN